MPPIQGLRAEPAAGKPHRHAPRLQRACRTTPAPSLHPTLTEAKAFIFLVVFRAQAHNRSLCSALRGGRCNAQARNFVRDLVRLRAYRALPAVRAAAAASWAWRWWSMLAVAVQQAVTSTAASTTMPLLRAGVACPCGPQGRTAGGRAPDRSRSSCSWAHWLR